MTRRIGIIVVTGSECTGKTTLAADLAAHFQTTWSREFAREYLDRKSRPLEESDVAAIGRGQARGEDLAMASAAAIVVKDTDLVSTVIYSRHYYGACPASIEEAAVSRLGQLYLLLCPDVPWIPDGLHRDRPERRLEIHELFRTELARRAVRTVEIRGSWEDRRARAIRAIEDLIAENP